MHGAAAWRSLDVRLGAARSWHDIETHRSVSLTGLTDAPTAAYDATTTQAFAEVSTPLVATARTAVEPFAGVAAVRTRATAFDERGGSVALQGERARADVSFATLGARASHALAVGGTVATVRGMFAWQHASGDRAPLVELAFSGRTDRFGIEGASVVQDAALLEGELDVALSRRAGLSFSYTGRIGSGTRDHGLRAQLRATF